MADPQSLGAALSLVALGSFVFDYFRSKAKGAAVDYVDQTLKRVIARCSEGQAIGAEDLDDTLRSALTQATRVLAYHLHDPGRKSLGQLLENFSDWPDLAHRLLEVTQNNILAGTATDHWLATLIEESKEPGNFKDLPLDLVLADHSLTRLLEDQSDLKVKQAIHDLFLGWVDRHVPDNGGKPRDFAASVTNGWPVGKGGDLLCFYDVVCVFFREQLKDDDRVFRAFTTNVLTGLKCDLAGIRSALPDAATLQRFTEALAAFEDKEFDANYARFKQHLKRQNDKVLALLREEFTAVHEHLDRQEGAAERRHQETQDRLAGLEALLRAQLQQPKPLNSPGPILDFPRALREWAQQHGITPEQARQEVGAWIAETRRTCTDLSELARAEFLAQRFAEAARLSDQAAAEKLARREQLAAEHRQLTDEAVNDLTRAGEALRARLDFAGALSRFEQALNLLVVVEQPLLWASLQVWLGMAHRDLGIRVGGNRAQCHLRSAVTAYRAALPVYKCAQLLQAWATTQNNLGIALRDQAGRSEGAAAVCLLAEAATACREALSVQTRTELPKDWAATQNNLGNTLRDQAGRSEGDKAVCLLAEAVTAYREALKVRTRAELPQEWAMTQNNLGNTLRDQAGRSEGDEAVCLLAEAVTAYREALTVRTRPELPQAWAMTQNNLGLALSDQAGRSEGDEAVCLLAEAVTAYREALTVRTRAELPQAWAMTQNNLGNTLRDQAGRSEGAAAVCLLAEAVTTYREALWVYTRAELPQDWAMTQNNLCAALCDQADRSGGDDAVCLLAEAVTAYREALKVRTRAELPQEWAITQNNLGLALCNQAGRNEGADAVRLLGEAVDAYRAALTVFTREFHPHYHGIVSGSLAEAEAALAKLRGESAP
jgi:tetratricopeptide (TPR) repeat protein